MLVGGVLVLSPPILASSGCFIQAKQMPSYKPLTGKAKQSRTWPYLLFLASEESCCKTSRTHYARLRLSTSDKHVHISDLPKAPVHSSRASEGSELSAARNCPSGTCQMHLKGPYRLSWHWPPGGTSSISQVLFLVQPPMSIRPHVRHRNGRKLPPLVPPSKVG
jgi:hypothetical protein